MKSYTLKDLTTFVLKYRRGKAFEKHTEEEIIQDLHQAQSLSCMVYCINPLGEVNGLAIGSRFPELNMFFVTQALASESGVLNALLQKFRKLYPTYRIEARRHGRIYSYRSTDKLINKVSSLTKKGII